MSRDEKVYLYHILDAIKDIESFLEDVEEPEFLKSKLLQDAVIRNLEVIGEASKNLPKTIKDLSPQIEWKRMAGLRDILIHEYFGVDIGNVWRIIRKRLPGLKREIEKVLHEM